ncbi:MAG: class I tRNA ligase family protein [Fimbriimonas sp.]
MEKQYILVMFPYPSGEGLHVGHWYNYAIVDSYCRWLNRKGIPTFQPFGYDAFGLPAENYARKVGGDPREITYRNIENFRAEMGRMNTRYEERLVTSEPDYVRWTQWTFLKLHEHGLAYKRVSPVNYCPSCATVLANEQVKDGRCERCETTVEVRELDQWFVKITAYRDRMIANLDWLDYPEKTKKQQRQWLANLHDWCVSRQRKWGCPIPIAGEEDTLDTFVDSSFYYLRYLSPDADDVLVRPEDYRPVDLYVGGNEHACMHLIYARFIHMFLYDVGVVPCEEPFRRVFHQGMITFGGAKMSKSKGNVVDPKGYDPDALRMHLMFIGPYADGGDWDDRAFTGIPRFLDRFRRWLAQADERGEPIDLDSFETQIDGYLAAFKVNKIVSDFMILYNANKGKTIDFATRDALLEMLRCFAPGFQMDSVVPRFLETADPLPTL